MLEIISTRTNEMIDPIMHVWGWEIPVYLFLGGFVAGMMIISGYFILSGRTRNTQCSCFIIPIISIAAISLGMVALFLDLEHKLYFWRLYTTFQPDSPMSWGAWILLLVYPILIANAIIRVPDWIGEKFEFLKKLSKQINEHEFGVKTIGAMSMIVGGVLGMYTGVLLSTMAARPAWNSAMLWVLFLVSGLSTAAAFIHLIAADSEERKLLAKADNGFLITELLIIILMIIGFVSSVEIHQQAAALILGGPFTASFWVFVIALGIVIPLIIQLLAVNNKVQHTPIAPIMVIAGGLILRFVIVGVGQYSHWPTAFFPNP
ncbi:MAG: NrfD/PsrC family molybdoenzyme membrane anchor subunit [Candidatus Kapaibacterium sp.]